MNKTELCCPYCVGEFEHEHSGSYVICDGYEVTCPLCGEISDVEHVCDEYCSEFLIKREAAKTSAT